MCALEEMGGCLDCMYGTQHLAWIYVCIYYMQMHMHKYIHILHICFAQMQRMRRVIRQPVRNRSKHLVHLKSHYLGKRPPKLYDSMCLLIRVCPSSGTTPPLAIATGPKPGGEALDRDGTAGWNG